MNRSIISLLRRSTRQLELIYSSGQIGKRSAIAATATVTDSIYSHDPPSQYQYQPLNISQLANLQPQPASATTWISTSKAPRFQQTAKKLETEAPESRQGGPPEAGKGDRPPLEKQLIVYNTLRDGLPKIFATTMDYRIYNRNLVFINNLIGKTTQGLPAYMQQVSFLRTIGHFKFAYVRFEILNMSHDVDTARVTVRWRIVGVGILKVLLKFWKFSLWRRQELQKQIASWYDGISYFDIGSDGLVWRHIADKVEEDKDRIVAEKSKASLAAKLALLAIALKPVAGVAGEPATSELSELFFGSFF
jgi:hypothetical protein